MNLGAYLRLFRSLLFYGSFVVGCAAPSTLASPSASSSSSSSSSGSSSGAPHGPALGESPALTEVAAIHGGAGPWAVAGYRMGDYALKELGLARFSFDLDVQHRTPKEVQFSCIADGAAAATGASVGKLNLTLVDADEAHVATTYRRKSTGREITLRPTRAFAARFQNVPREKLGEAGREVLSLKDQDIFEVVPQN